MIKLLKKLFIKEEPWIKLHSHLVEESDCIDGKVALSEIIPPQGLEHYFLPGMEIEIRYRDKRKESRSLIVKKVK